MTAKRHKITPDLRAWLKEQSVEFSVEDDSVKLSINDFVQLCNELSQHHEAIHHIVNTTGPLSGIMADVIVMLDALFGDVDDAHQLMHVHCARFEKRAKAKHADVIQFPLGPRTPGRGPRKAPRR